MSENETTTLAPSQSPFFATRDYVWMISTFTITPVVASLLSLGGYIPTDPVTAAIDGLLVSIMYVGYRVINGYRRLRLRRETKEEIADN